MKQTAQQTTATKIFGLIVVAKSGHSEIRQRAIDALWDCCGECIVRVMVMKSIKVDSDYSYRGMSFEERRAELLGECYIAFRSWLDEFDPSMGVPFLAYVCKKSLWMMQDNKRKNSKSRIQVVNPVGVEAHDDNGNGPKGRRSKLSPIENCDFNPFTDEVISFERNQEECNLVAKIHETVKEDFKMARFLELLSEVCAESDFYSDAKVGEKMGCTRANTSVRHKKLVQFLREKGLEDEFRMLMAA
jgi:hypothetical protein